MQWTSHKITSNSVHALQQTGVYCLASYGDWNDTIDN